jgi:3'-phosphoadenosine 5'-phosphosulfate sulfotransferase (PAPS reductase)/FAD synthetase
MKPIKRVVSWFSCGITSAVASKLTIEKYAGIYPVVIAYCDTSSEHPDNKRFLGDCEKWFGQPITILHSKLYEDVWDVFQKTNWLNGIEGARCSTEMKKKVRQDFEDVEFDLQVFGFFSKEVKRAEKFQKNNPEVRVEFPLIERNMSKKDCLLLVQSAGIEVPAMYQQGYKNNNCIGCVKGAKGYWNKIRRDFPEIFERMAKEERRLGHALNITQNPDGSYYHIFLDELPEDMGNYKSDLPIQCGLFCGEL